MKDRIMIDAELMAKHIAEFREKLQKANRTIQPPDILEDVLRREVKYQHPDIDDFLKAEE